MKLLAFTDLRTTNELPEVNADIVVLLGRIPSIMVKKIVDTYDCVIVGLLSNKCHPSLYDDFPIINIHGKVIEVEGKKIAGYGGVPFYNCFDTTGLYTEEETKNFVSQLEVSNVDILVSYSNVAYGDLPSTSNSKDGFKAYNRIILEGIVPRLIHGRLKKPFVRKMGKVTIESVYPFSIIEI